VELRPHEITKVLNGNSCYDRDEDSLLFNHDLVAVDSVTSDGGGTSAKHDRDLLRQFGVWRYRTIRIDTASYSAPEPDGARRT